MKTFELILKIILSAYCIRPIQTFKNRITREIIVSQCYQKMFFKHMFQSSLSI
ncbi:hypothetical protein FWK35_00036921, partial [Aphis craccivora]